MRFKQSARLVIAYMTVLPDAEDSKIDASESADQLIVSLRGRRIGKEAVVRRNIDPAEKTFFQSMAAAALFLRAHELRREKDTGRMKADFSRLTHTGKPIPEFCHGTAGRQGEHRVRFARESASDMLCHRGRQRFFADNCFQAITFN